MSKDIHGHAVLDLLSEQALTREAVKAEFITEHGEAVRFRTCKSEGLTFDELFDFFLEKEKVVQQGEGFVANGKHRC